jgi:hypothetical protein
MKGWGELTGFFDKQWDRVLCELSRNESLTPCFARKRIRQLLRPAPRPITPNVIQVALKQETPLGESSLRPVVRQRVSATVRSA